MAPFDPRAQTFVLLAADGVTEIPVSVPDVNTVIRENLATSINYASQLGASFIMLLVLICMSPTTRLAKASQWVHIVGLLLCIIRLTFLTVYFTSDWTEFYSFWALDYSTIAPSQVHTSITAEVFSFLFFVSVQVALGMQAWAMVNLLPDFWKWFFVALSGVMSLLAIAFRLVVSVVQIVAMLNIFWERLMWVVITSSTIATTSIFYYCALFNVKLVTHLIVSRRVLPSRRGLTPMEILVITNGLLMIIPVVFAGLQWGDWTIFQAGSVTYTSVVIFLPLGGLVAQRASFSSSTYELARNDTGTGNSITPLKFGSHFGTNPTDSTCVPSTVTSRIEATRSRDIVDPIDLELREIDEGGSNPAEKGGVRVNREFDRREERI
ncbi:pheromone receptor [Sodiomyces alkalinus F11]|uniref:Pheromone receptor n=1 Tax=Sodiomyces alkalinus (strain CBS 110278 / VKM F-3762 / F11) TaxID=1314773 RepID=A0A3N2Q2D9_SODAK|nr:pheromone receptor [Sodiomyces alkalinus F11]ROT40924.1 pheromone receptor [Sodiomyces alkalinus F11]